MSTDSIQSKVKTKADSKIGKVEIDRDLCIGAGTCEVLASNAFKLDSEAKVYIDNLDGDSDQDIIDAANSCPVFAIKIYDKAGNLICPK